MFMLISGFLMTWHFLEREEKEPWEMPTTWLKFYLRRFFRIAPLYYVVLAIGFLVQHRIAQIESFNQGILNVVAVTGPNDPTDSAITVGNILAHLTFAFGFIPKYCANTPLPDWSIGLEMQFYLAFPFLALFLRRFPITGLFSIVGVNWLALRMFAIGASAEPGAWGLFPMATLLPFRINCFLSGIFIAFALSESDRGKPAWKAGLGMVAAVFHMKKFAAICLLFFIYEFGSNKKIGAFAAPAKRFIRLRVFKVMADLSYGVYLIHSLVIPPVLWLLIRFFKLQEMSPILRFISCVFIVIPVTYAIALVVHKAIELRGIELGKVVVRRFRRGATDAKQQPEQPRRMLA